MSDLGYFTSLGKELGLEGEELLKFATNSWREQKDIAREERKIARKEKQEAEEREEKRLAREDRPTCEAAEREERDRKVRLEVEEKEKERRHEMELLTAKNRQELELAKCTQESEEVVSSESESGSERSRHVGPKLFARIPKLPVFNSVTDAMLLVVEHIGATRYRVRIRGGKTEVL